MELSSYNIDVGDRSGNVLLGCKISLNIESISNHPLGGNKTKWAEEDVCSS